MTDFIRTTAELAAVPVGTVLDDSQDILLKVTPSETGASWLVPGSELDHGDGFVLLPATVLRWGAGKA